MFSKNSMFAFFSKALESGKPLIISALVAMFYSVDEYGQFAYVVAIFMVISVVAEFRLQSILIKKMSTCEPEKIGIILGSSFLVNFIFACIGFFIVVIFSLYEDSELVSLGLLILSISFFAKIPRAYRALYIANQQYKWIAKSEFVSGVVSLFLIIIFTANKINMLWVFVVRVLDFSILSLLFYQNAKNLFDYTDIKLSFDFEYSKDLIKLSFPLVISGTAMILFQKLDLIMINNILDNTHTGYYAFAAIFMTLFSMPALIFSESLAPIMFRSVDSDCTIKQYFSNVVILVGCFMSILMFLTISPIIDNFFIEKYKESLELISFMSIVPFLIALGAAAGQIIVHDNTQKKSFIKSVIGLCVSVALNVILIPIYGVLGAIISTIFGLLVSNFFGHVFFKEYRYIFVIQCKGVLYPFYYMWVK